MDNFESQAISRLTKDLREASATLSRREARYLVDCYYSVQEYRKAASNQVRALSKSGEPHSVLGWLFAQMESMERQVKLALDQWSDADALGRWAKSICGIGPVIASGLLAHIDLEVAVTVSHIWRFAGLDPTVTWERKQKRPWNASLKTLCWKIGESFVKVSGREQDFYGKHYVARKALETQRNERGEFARQAAAILAAKRIGKETLAYQAYVIGKLPLGHIHARAKRWTVKLFLSHYHHVGWCLRTGGDAPPKPFAFSHLGHGDFIAPPNWDSSPSS